MSIPLHEEIVTDYVSEAEALAKQGNYHEAKYLLNYLVDFNLISLESFAQELKVIRDLCTHTKSSQG